MLSDGETSAVRNVEVSMDLRESAVFMSEDASFSVDTHPVFPELRAILCLIGLTQSSVLLCDSVAFCELFFTMSVVASFSELAVLLT